MVSLEHSPVASSPKVLGGALVFRGTRVPAQTLLDYLNDRFTLDEFLDSFPSVSRSLAEEFSLLAKDNKIENHCHPERLQS